MTITDARPSNPPSDWPMWRHPPEAVREREGSCGGHIAVSWRLNTRMAVGVFPDADHGDLRLDRLEELRDRRRGTMMGNLQHVGLQRGAAVEQPLLRRLFRLGGEQHRVVAAAQHDDKGVVVGIGLGARPALVRRQDVQPKVSDRVRGSGPRVLLVHTLVLDRRGPDRSGTLTRPGMQAGAAIPLGSVPARWADPRRDPHAGDKHSKCDVGSTRNKQP